MGNSHMLFGVGESQGQTFYAPPFFKLETDIELSPALFDCISAFLLLLSFLFDQGEFLFSLLQFYTSSGKFSTIFLGLYATSQYTGMRLLGFFEGSKPFSQGLETLETRFQLRSC